MSVKLSVVIPVYNGAAFIAETIRAVLRQTWQDREIVIVNDGSRDATLAELAQFGDAIRIISIPNGGVSNARNVGIKASTGEVIAFLDADDVWYPNKLERQWTAMERYPDVGFSCSNFGIIDHRTGLPAAHFDQFRHLDELVMDRPLDHPLEVLIPRNFVGTCSNVMVRRSVLEQTGLFDPRFRQSEDFDLWLRCAAVTRFLVLSEVLLDKNKHETNLTNNFVETLEYHDQVLTALLTSPLIAARPQLAPLVHQAIATVRYAIGNGLFNRGQSRDGFAYFQRAWNEQRSLANTAQFVRESGRKLVRLLLESLRLRTPQRD